MLRSDHRTSRALEERNLINIAEQDIEEQEELEITHVPIDYSQASWQIITLGGSYAISRFISTAGRLANAKMFSEYDALYNTKTLPALGLINPTQTLLIGTGIGGLFATSILMADALAKNNLSDIGIIYQRSIIAGLGFSFPVVLIMTFTDPILTSIFQQNETLSGITQEYFRALAPAVPFLFTNICVQQLAMGISKKALVIASAASYTLLSSGFGYALIFGKGPFPALGPMKGLGYGTTIGMAITAILSHVFLYFNKTFKPYRLFDFQWDEAHYAYRLFSLGWPIAIQAGSELAIFQGMAFMAGRLGDDSITVQAIVQLLLLTVYFPVLSGSKALGLLVKTAFSHHDFTSIKRYAITGHLLGIGISTLAFVGAVTLPDIGISFFNINDEKTIALARSVFCIRFLGEILDSSANMSNGALRGLLLTKVPMYLRLFSMGLVGLSLAGIMTFPLNLKLEGLSWAINIGLALNASTVFFYLYKKFNELEDATTDIEEFIELQEHSQTQSCCSRLLNCFGFFNAEKPRENTVSSIYDESDHS